MTRKKVVPKVERPLWQKIFLSIVLIGGVLFMYIMGLNHGAMRTSFAIGSANCELMDGMMPIYPYGCEHNDSSDNYCIDMNCQALSLGITPVYDNNGAVCLHINNSDVSKARMDAFFVSLGLTGCPGQLHTIGMNKITGNRNWLINKIEMSEWNNISKINDTRPEQLFTMNPNLPIMDPVLIINTECYAETTCPCAMNTTTPCMAMCFKWVNKTGCNNGG